MGTGTAKPSSLERVENLKNSFLILADELHKPIIKKLKNLIKEKYIHNLKIIFI